MDFSKIKGTKGHQGYTQICSETEKSLQKIKQFSGRPVKVVEPKQTYAWVKVHQHLTKTFGDEISAKVLKNSNPKPLSERKVRGLYAQAEKLKTSNYRKNQVNLNKWINLGNKSSVATKALQKTQPNLHPWQFSAVEKAKVEDFLKEKLSSSHGVLSKSQVQQQCIESLWQYQSHFQQLSPEVSSLVKKNSSLKGPVFNSQLTEFATKKKLDPQGEHMVARFAATVTRSAHLLKSSPFDLRASATFKTQRNEVKHQQENILKLRHSIQKSKHLPTDISKAILKDLERQNQQLTNHDNYLSVVEANDFASLENFNRVRKEQVETAKNVLQEAIDQANKSKRVSAKQVTKLASDIVVWQTEKNMLSDELDKPFVTDPPVDMAKTLKQSKKELQQNLEHLGIKKKFIKKHWNKAWNTVANERDWEAVKKETVVRRQGKVLRGESVLVPASKIRYTQDKAKHTGERDPFEHSYQGKGLSSSTKTNTEHALNLYQTKFSAKNKQLFSGVRSGTIAAQKITNQEQRKQACENWAKEVVTASLLDTLERHPEMVKDIEAGKAIPLKIVSTSMLTPDWFRHLSHIHDDELKLQQEQYQALHELAESGEPLTLYDASGNVHKVATDLEVATFNTGVNKLSLHPAASTLLHSWQQADSYNNEAMQTLIGNLSPEAPEGGWAGEWLKENTYHPDADKVRSLVQQIRLLYLDNEHHREGQDAYKLMTRIQLLAHLTGITPHFNCKSGKDRTGEADARIKELALETEQSGEVPDPNSRWGIERKEQLQAMMFGAGEAEVLLNNVGDPRFKTATGREQQGALFSLLHYKK